MTPEPPSPVEPPAPAAEPHAPLPYRKSEGLVMLAVLGLGLVVSIVLVFWLL